MPEVGGLRNRLYSSPVCRKTVMAGALLSMDDTIAFEDCQYT